MKFVSRVGIGVLLFSAVNVFAQEGPTGKFSGTYSSVGGGPASGPIGLSLEITSVKDGAVQGSVYRFTRRYCRGEFKVAGTFAEDTLHLKTVEKGGAAGDCTVNLVLKREGNKLSGKFNGMDTELSK